MAKRRSLNRRSSRFGRSSSRSSIGSNILDPDSNLLEEEQPFWWNVSLLKSSTHVPIVNEASTVLNPDSQLEDAEEEEWWRHLQTSPANRASVSKAITKSPVTLETVEDTSSSASEESISKVQKRKVLLRKTTQKSRESNAFQDALDNSEGASRPESVRLKDWNKFEQIFVPSSLRQKEKIDEDSDTSHETHVDHSYHRVVKKKTNFLRKERRSKSINPFEEIFSQENASPRSSPARSVRHSATEGSVNQGNIVRTSRINVKNIDDLNGDTKSHKDSKNTSTASTNVGSTDESDVNAQFLKPKSRFLRRTRRSSSRNIFENILADEGNNDSNESLGSGNKNSSTRKDDSASEFLTKPANGSGLLKSDFHGRSNSKHIEKDEKTFKNISRTSAQDVVANKEATNVQQTSDLRHVDTPVEETRTRKNWVNKSLNESLIKNHVESASIDKADCNRISRSEDRLIVSRNKRNEANLSNNVAENERPASVNNEKKSSRSENNKRASKSVNVNEKLSISNKELPIKKRTLYGAQAEANNSRISKDISEQPKDINVGTSEKKENSEDFQLQLSTSSDSSDVIQQLPINQSLAQKTLESDVTLNTFRNLNVAASSTPIELNRKSKLKRLSNFVHSSVSNVAQEFPRKKPAANSLSNESNHSSLAKIHEEDEEDAVETPQDITKRKSSSRVSENRTKRQRTLNDDESKEAVYTDGIVDEGTISSTKNFASSRKRASSSARRNRSRLRTPDKRRKDDSEENDASLPAHRSLSRRSQSQMEVGAEEEEEDGPEENIPSPSLRRQSSRLHKVTVEETLEERFSSPTIGRKTKARMTFEEEDDINISSSRRTRSQLVLNEEGETGHEGNAASPRNTSIEKNQSGPIGTPEKGKRSDAEESLSTPARKMATRRTRSRMALDEGEHIPKEVSSAVSSNDAQSPKRLSVSDKEKLEKNLAGEAKEDEEEVKEGNLSAAQERRSPRNKNTPAMPKSRNEKDKSEVADKRRTDSRTFHATLRRSNFLGKDDAPSNSPAATNVSRGQRTLGDFFKGRSPSKSVLERTATVGPLSSQAFADKQKVEEVRRKLEELKKRKLSELEANLNRRKKQAVSEILKPKVAAKKPPRVKNIAEIDKAYIVNGHVYKRPKLTRPKRWVTDRLYKFLWKRMEPKYGLATRVRSEKFVLGLCEVVGIVCRRKKYENYKDELNALMMEMARIGIIRTRKDFYDFSYDFLPAEFREKAVPMVKPGNVRNIPHDPSTVFEPLIPQEE